jgi:hypothetical protein
MTQETEKNINEAINWLQQTGSAIQNFASEQSPIYFREVVEWTFWYSALCGGLGLVLVTLGIVGAFKMKSWIDKVGGHPSYTFNIFGTFLLLIFGIFLTCEHIPNAIKAKVAPRTVLIEHLNGLRK